MRLVAEVKNFTVTGRCGGCQQQGIDNIINDEDARAADRIAAARTLMSGAQAYQERRILERQIQDLERQLLRFTATPEIETTAVSEPDDDDDDSDSLDSES